MHLLLSPALALFVSPITKRKMQLMKNLNIKNNLSYLHCFGRKNDIYKQFMRSFSPNSYFIIWRAVETTPYFNFFLHLIPNCTRTVFLFLWTGFGSGIVFITLLHLPSALNLLGSSSAAPTWSYAFLLRSGVYTDFQTWFVSNYAKKRSH